MFSDKLCCVDTKAAASFFGARQLPVIRIDLSQIESLPTALSHDFYNEPQFKYLLPDEEMRRTLVPCLFRYIARSGQVFGEIYTTEDIDGGAVWISRGDTFTLEGLARTAILVTPFKLGWSSFRRYINLSRRLQTVHERLASGPHWYLMSLGLKPSKLENNIAPALLRPLLSRADSDGLPCYLETFRERDLPFYKDFGFRVEGAGRIPTGGPNFWAMIRPPQ